jgi:hypothetical protein
MDVSFTPGTTPNLVTPWPGHLHLGPIRDGDTSQFVGYLVVGTKSVDVPQVGAVPQLVGTDT